MRTLKRQIQIKRMDENGLTLVEVLVSVVLLTIIITIFLNVFIQSAQTNTSSEEIVDATYIAQTEMERIYSESQHTEYVKREEAFDRLDYGSLANEDEWLVFRKKINEDYYVKVKLQKEPMEEATNMNRLIITVHSEPALGKKQALMENIILWGEIP